MLPVSNPTVQDAFRPIWDCMIQRGVSKSGASSILSVGMVLCYRAVECNVASFPLLYAERLSKS